MAEQIKTSIDITVFNKDGVETNEKRTVKVKPIRAFQFINLTTLISQIIKQLDEEGSLSSVVAEFVGASTNATDREDLLRLAGKAFYKDASQSISLLLSVVPDKALDILSVLSQVDKFQLALQEPDVLFDIIDAVVEANDFKKVIDRVKKSTKLLTSKLTYKVAATEAVTGLTNPTLH